MSGAPSETMERSLPRALAERLLDLLRLHTGTPERCWFAVWEGAGDLPFDDRWPKRTAWDSDTLNPVLDD